MREFKCHSGAILKINAAPFKDARALYKAVLKEAKGVDVSSKTEIPSLYKELFCVAFSSDEVEKALWACLNRCTYDNGNGDLKIDDSTFEPVAARDDYLQVCMEVAKENVLPFGKSLYAEYLAMLAMSEKDPA